MNGLRISLSIALVSLLLLLIPQGTKARETCDRVIAIVNNDIITLYELNAKLKEISGVDPADLQKKDEHQFFLARWKVLDGLIDERLAAAKAKELGITVSPEEVDKAIERMKRNSGISQEELLKGIKSRGLSLEQYREKFKQELQRVQLINYEVKSKIIIRDEKIKEYYEKNKKDFTSPGEVHLAAIFLKKKDSKQPGEEGKIVQQAKEIISQLRNGADFGALARKYSQGPGAAEGGDLGFFKTSQLDEVLGKVAASLPAGGVSEPIEREAGVQILKIIEKREAGLRPLSAVKDQIYDHLYREEVNKRFVSWIKELREKSYIKVLF
jgi:peptidyl-prolyl cis-trans isomerase SurA